MTTKRKPRPAPKAKPRTAAKPKPRVPECPCGDGPIVEPWPCCDACRREHFLWPLPEECAGNGAVIAIDKALEAMTGVRHPRIELRVRLRPPLLEFAWRRIGRLRWTSLGNSDEASYFSFPTDVDTSAYHWWSQTLAGVFEELGATDTDDDEGDDD